MKDFQEKIKNAENLISELISNREIITGMSDNDRKKFIVFYKKQAHLSITAADILFNTSTNSKSKDFHSLDENEELFLWVINPAYYSMFYAVNMILAYKGVRILSKRGVHKIISNAFLYFCIRNDFIAKELYNQFVETQEEAGELLGLEDFKVEAKHLSKEYLYEVEKRTKFTYETDSDVKEKHANTSLRRAKEFYNKLRQIIEK